jgi:hypothetical protein
MLCVPCNGHIHGIIKSLFPIVNRSLGLSNVGANPTIIVRELRLVFDEATVELDDIRVL